jgi:hypothetical protein
MTTSHYRPGAAGTPADGYRVEPQPAVPQPRSDGEKAKAAK